jgi:hypothetical protein
VRASLANTAMSSVSVEPAGHSPTTPLACTRRGSRIVAPHDHNSVTRRVTHTHTRTVSQFSAMARCSIALASSNKRRASGPANAVKGGDTTTATEK